MATVRPFTAWMPPAAVASRIASVPYDVVNSAEAATLADGEPLSFLHVIRPEIDLPPGTGLYDGVVYERARANLDRLLRDVPYEERPGTLLVYRLIREGRAQIGIVGGCSVDEYDDGTIAVHERTRAAKEDDRTRHVITMRCQAEPIFLAYRGDAVLDALITAATETAPLYDFRADDGIQHTLWTAPDPAAISAAFEAVPMLYVADGHHRAKSASRARAELKDGADEQPCDSVMAVCFPDSQLQILAYNRVVTDLGTRSSSGLIAALRQRFTVRDDAGPIPPGPGHVQLFADERWFGVALPAAGDTIIDNLDVSRLQEQVLAPLLGIEDPRRDKRIEFVGGARGTMELERRATASGGIAFSMHPTSLAELFAVADAGEIMPPKSTWFEPKLRSGLFVHRI